MISSSEGARELIRVLRANNPQLSLLSVEVLLWCAEGPRTAAELQRLTGVANGPLMRACWPYLTRTKNFTREVVVSELPLLKRMRKGKRAPVYVLSVNGWKVLKGCGLL